MITEDSPLAGLTKENCAKRMVFVEAFICGTDEAFLQQVFTMRVFYPKDVTFGHKFVNMVDPTPRGALT